MIARRVGPIPSMVTLSEVKANGRILHDDDDLLLQHFIDAAHERAEQETGRVFGDGQWVLEYDRESARVPAPIRPILTVPAGWSIETDGRAATLVAGEWPADRRVTVTAGEPMPETVRQAVIMLACHWFDQRNAVSGENMHDVPYSADALLRMNRRMFA